eukprot:comp24088_c0_seq1/m.43412 comp24088_c0_seq1/g.43412  ORF comp24088_c0_seq1/g.43412 comp24088_c0_seq1/m.43412 type:complete len:1332 (-) comp24088_c0_seq1:182-4177(-)
METEEFQLPVRRGDLETGHGTTYVVQTFLEIEQESSSHVLGTLKDAISDLRENGPFAILNQTTFDTFYCFLRGFKNVPVRGRGLLYSSLTESLAQLKTELAPVLADGRISHSDSMKGRNALKMHIFLLQWAVQEFECQATAPTTEAKPTKNHKTKKARVDDDVFDLTQLHVEMLCVMKEVMSLKLGRLWGAKPEEELINLVSKACFQLLENPIYSKDQGREAIEAMAHVVGIAVEDYGLSGGLVLMTVVTRIECAGKAVADLLSLVADSHPGATRLGSELLREIGRMDPEDLVRDTKSTKYTADFLVELAGRIPALLYQNMAVLLQHLDVEAPTMRGAILEVIAIILTRVLKKDESKAGRHARDDFLDLMLERLHDTNALVRKRCLSIWGRLCESQAIPLAYYQKVLNMVAGRFVDSSIQCRPEAMRTINAMVRHNPYFHTLQLSTAEEKLAAEQAKLQVLEEAVEKAKAEKAATNEAAGDDSKEEEEAMEVEKNEDEENEEEVAPKALTAEEQELQGQRHAVQYLVDVVGFIKQLHTLVPTICEMLISKYPSDAVEAVDLVSVLRDFSLEPVANPRPGEPNGIRLMLVLMFSKEEKVKQKVLEVYARHVFQEGSEDMEERVQTAMVVRNLVELTIGATLAELTSLSELVRHMYTAGHIRNRVVAMLWDVYLGKVPNTSVQYSRGALIVLSMLASASPQEMEQHLPSLLSSALGARGHSDPLVARYACTILQDTLSPKGRLDVSSPILRSLGEYLVLVPNIPHASLVAMTANSWYAAAQECINAIYGLADQPHRIMAAVIVGMTNELAAHVDNPPQVQQIPVSDHGAQQAPDDEAIPPSPAPAVPDMNNIDLSALNEGGSVRLARLLFVLGHTAVRQLGHMEAIEGHMKKLRIKDRDEKEKDKKGPSMEEELGLGQSAADDTLAEEMLKTIDEEIVMGPGLLAQYTPLILRVCRKRSGDPLLGPPGVLALCKYMTVSQSFCMAPMQAAGPNPIQALQLLFTLLEKCALPEIRGNLIICAGDLAVRFPNLIEPWTPQLYSRLKDDTDGQVRKNTLMVLTHLILNEMIKVKGQISNIAACIVDEDKDIAGLSRLFFRELALKENAIYNILPDIISRLSNPEDGLPEEQFQIVIKELLAHIQKDKQSESLIERLCHRFRATTDERQWHDIAFCMTHLQFKEKGLRKLMDNIDCYKDKLDSVAVYSCFEQIVSKASKFIKPELKQELDRFKATIDRIHRKGTAEEGVLGEDGENPNAEHEDEDGLGTATKAAARTKPRASTKPKRGGKAKKKTAESDEDEFDLSDDEPIAKAGKGARNAAPREAAKKRKEGGSGR